MMRNANYGYYVGAFVDILGQKEAFQGINHLPRNEEEKRKLEEVDENTACVIERFRQRFGEFFAGYMKEAGSRVEVPKAAKKQFEAMRKCSLEVKFVADNLQYVVPLQSEEYHSPCINGVFGILGACGGMLLMFLAEGKPFRAGIDVGIGTRLRDGEVYGSAVFNAYALESKIAQYPRIVIGGNLINYLGCLSHKVQQLPNQTPEDIEWCKKLAECCLKMVVPDIDGHNILDYLGDNFQKNYTENLSGDMKELNVECFKKAFNFVESEYKKQRDAVNSKLATRYYMLYSYFQARRKFWTE